MTEHSFKAVAGYKNKKSIIHMPSVHFKVYPWGRFKNFLESKNVYEKYIAQFNSWYNEPEICPDLLQWPGIILEPNGDLNLCGSFEAINCHKARVSNILKGYEIMEKELIEFYEKERSWVIKNQDLIRSGKAHGCKLSNPFYSL